ncbi:PLP-dependent aminotransferase family protein [Larkinella insperata]|uniref:PLP-dependent aminotransferase family protein n=1 Tax=Larkinella insperata TaxID=332158 RepID=A0ABW3QB54_9BACT|nr:PLP-dependent aminotransferase family protein [Larkinella insperata]
MDTVKPNQLTVQQPEHLYLRIARGIEQQIRDEVLRVGDKLPSIRTICREQGVSMSTATQAYFELESRSLIESRPQSGYYVSRSPRKQLAVPQTSQPPEEATQESQEVIIQRVYSNINNSAIVRLSLGVPADELLPIAKLNKGLVQAMRELPASGTAYEEIQGNEKLRRQIAHRSFTWEGRLSDKDVVTTAGCMSALSFSLMALTQRGDTIAVESPVYFAVLQLAKSLGLNILELPTNPQTGVEMEAFQKALPKVKLAILVSNFNNPIGSCMPDEHKRQVVQWLQHYHVPLIEDDLYGDVYFSESRPKSCKTYDESGLVLWCGSVSKTLAPGYRVGWVAPGRFTEQITRMKLMHSVSSTTLTQEVIANFLENGRYENHLRKLRRTLHTNSLQYSRAIADYFPEGTRVSQPQGGFFLWVELDKRINTVELYNRALRHGISIAPGRMFTLQNQFDNCMRLSYGLPWNEKLDQTLKTLGTLAKSI